MPQNHLNISGQASDSYSELVGIQEAENSKGWNADTQFLLRKGIGSVGRGNEVESYSSCLGSFFSF